MPEGTSIYNKRDAVIVITDGSETYTVALEAGDFTFDVPLETESVYLDRGRLGSTPSVRLVDDQPITGSFSAYLKDVGDTGASYSTLTDILFRYASNYVASNWTSTLASSSDAFTVTIAVTFSGSGHGGADRTLTFAFSALRGGLAEGDPNTVNATFTSYILRPVLS